MDKKEIIKSALDKAMTYSEYRELIRAKRANGEATGGFTSEAMLNYTDMNEKRMDKWDKIIKVDEEMEKRLARIEEPEIWLVITEGWCGDAAHIVPVIHKLAEKNPQVDLRFVLRDEHLDLMDLYLTNGGRSIPVMLRLSANDLSEKCSWGPRPAPAQEVFLKGKKGEMPKEEVAKELQLFYGRDRGKTIMEEFKVFFD